MCACSNWRDCVGGGWTLSVWQTLSLSFFLQLSLFSTRTHTHTHNGKLPSCWNTKPSYLGQKQGPLFQPARRSLPFSSLSCTLSFKRPVRCSVWFSFCQNQISPNRYGNRGWKSCVIWRMCDSLRLLHAHCSARWLTAKKAGAVLPDLRVSMKPCMLLYLKGRRQRRHTAAVCFSRHFSVQRE